MGLNLDGKKTAAFRRPTSLYPWKHCWIQNPNHHPSD